MDGKTDRPAYRNVDSTRKYPLRGYILGVGPQGSSQRHMEQILLVTSCDSPAGIGASLRMDGHTEGQTDVKVEIVIQIFKSLKRLYSK